uniref:Laminin IV type A domain-containing protein n=1 Tax=Meloidogyne floridensis TaxID=298350 RepID=A0A915P649_9BILA
MPGDRRCKPDFEGRRCEHCALVFPKYPLCEPSKCYQSGSLNFETVKKENKIRLHANRGVRTEDLRNSKRLLSQVYYWSAPKNFLGNRLNTFGSNLYYFFICTYRDYNRGQQILMVDVVIEIQILSDINSLLVRARYHQDQLFMDFEKTADEQNNLAIINSHILPISFWGKSTSKHVLPVEVCDFL